MPIAKQIESIFKNWFENKKSEKYNLSENVGTIQKTTLGIKRSWDKCKGLLFGSFEQNYKLSERTHQADGIMVRVSRKFDAGDKITKAELEALDISDLVEALKQKAPEIQSNVKAALKTSLLGDGQKIYDRATSNALRELNSHSGLGLGVSEAICK